MAEINVCNEPGIVPICITLDLGIYLYPDMTLKLVLPLYIQGYSFLWTLGLGP